MALVLGGVVLVGAFGVVAAASLVLILALFRAGRRGGTQGGRGDAR
jgi:hypothetical protein